MACYVLKSRNLSERRKTGAPGSVQNCIQDPWLLGQNFPAVLSCASESTSLLNALAYS